MDRYPMTKAVFAIAALIAVSQASYARTIYPEWMSDFDASQQACQNGDVYSCKKRDDYWRRLRAAGFNFVIDKTNPNGYVWK